MRNEKARTSILPNVFFVEHYLNDPVARNVDASKFLLLASNSLHKI